MSDRSGMAGEVAELLQALIRNACVNDGSPDSGFEARNAATIGEYLGEAGERFEPHPGRVSLLYRVPGGTPGSPSLMLMGHTDVVPVSPEGWSVDPFAGERRHGFIWGRGAIDMLDQTAAMAVVFKRVLTGELRLPGDVAFLAVADEEAGGRLGARALVEDHWPLVASDFLLTEIATPALEGRSGRAIPVTVAEKGPQWRRLRASGTPGHGSQPYGTRNAVTDLAEAAAHLAATPAPVAITPEWRRFVEAWDPGDDLMVRLLDPDRVDGLIDEIAVEDPGMARWIHACTHLTVSPNLFHGGTKANVVADRAELDVDVRALPGQDQADVHDHFRKAIGPGFEELEYQVMEATSAGGSMPEGPLWEAITAALGDLAPDSRPVPTMIPVGTDARFFRPKGTVAYGVGLFDRRLAFGEFLAMFHGHDERVSEESLGLTAALYRRVLERFGTAV